MKRAYRSRWVRVLNLSKGTVVVEKALVAETFLGRARGLLFRPQISGSIGLLLVPCNSVHTFGMKYPIDVIHADSTGKILKLLTALAPNRIGPFVRRASWVLEIPAHWLEVSDTSEGDCLKISLLSRV